MSLFAKCQYCDMPHHEGPCMIVISGRATNPENINPIFHPAPNFKCGDTVKNKLTGEVFNVFRDQDGDIVEVVALPRNRRFDASVLVYVENGK